MHVDDLRVCANCFVDDAPSQRLASGTNPMYRDARIEANQPPIHYAHFIHF